MTPTARTLKYLREKGYTADVVERWIGGGQMRIRKDLFGLGDVLAFAYNTLLIQCTSGSNITSRMRKAEANPILKRWLAERRQFFAIGWRKILVGERRRRWMPDIREAFLSSKMENECGITWQEASRL
jgi:hypothetical protein